MTQKIATSSIKSTHYLFIAKLWLYLLFALSLFIIVLPFMPSNSLTQVIEYTLYLSPRWIFLLVFIPVIFFWTKLNKYRRLILLFCVIILLQFQDFQLNVSTKTVSDPAVKLISLNMGGKTSKKYLKNLIKREQPDIFLFQETLIEKLNGVFDTHWKLQCDAGLCIASQYPYKKIGEQSRRVFKGWGNFAVYYEIDVKGKTLPLMNVHFETPRSILSDLLGLAFDWQEVERFRENKSLETALISSWASSQPYFVMAGDFNMTVDESLYKDYFLSFQNAIDMAGLGINFTKYTSWHGVRIDHVLASKNITFSKAKVLSSLGGDHRAILTEIVLP